MPPPPGEPAETLRWVRRVSLAGIPVFLLFAAVNWAGESWFPWLVIGVIVYAVYGAVSMHYAIRRAERHGPLTQDELAAGRRRADRFERIYPPTLGAMCFGAGYLVGGVVVGLVLAAVGVVNGGLGVWLSRRRRARNRTARDQGGTPDAGVTEMDGVLAATTQRLFAWALDGVILGVSLSPLNPALYSSQPSATLFLALNIPAIALALAYLTLFDGSERGATPGKRIVGIRVADATNRGPIGYRRAAVRRLGYALGGLALGIGWLSLLIDPRRQTWHDKLARSIVIRTR